jgi:hypothetical protein
MSGDTHPKNPRVTGEVAASGAAATRRAAEATEAEKSAAGSALAQRGHRG